MTWSEVAGRLAGARSYWLGSTTASGAPHVTPVWGVVTGETLLWWRDQSEDRWEPSMDSAELRAVQQPLKDAYREEPEKAVVTLRARGQLDDAISCSVETGRALAVAGLHPATGGDGSLLCSGDMLLQALVACAGVTLRAVATSLHMDIAGGTVTAEGDLDFRGTLAVSKDAPVGFRSIRLAFDLDIDASAEQVQTLLRLTERYCVVYQTLAHPTELTVSA
jgi:uncharacterized OsmC-like protein